MEVIIIVKEKFTYDVFDLTKLVLAIFVIALHTGPFKTCVYESFFIGILDIAVPVYFVISGFLLYEKFRINNDSSIFLFHAKKLIKSYFALSLFYLPLALYQYYNLSCSVMFAVKNYLQYLFFVGEHFYSWPLWYLLASIYSCLFYYWLYKTKNITKKNLLLLITVFSFISMMVDYLLIGNFENSRIFSTVLFLIQRTFVNARLVKAFIFIPVGFIVSLNKEKIKIDKQNIICFIIIFLSIILIIYLIPNYLDNWMYIVFSYYFVCLLVKKREKDFLLECDNFLKINIRKLSTYMYYYHMYIVFFLNMFIFKDLYNSGLELFILTTVIIICLCIIKLKFFKNNRLI